MFPALIIVLGVTGLSCIWCLICWVTSRISGWHALSVCFPAGPHEPADVQMNSMETMRMGVARYKGGVSIGISPAGLYMKVIWALRFGSDPILISWEAITKIEDKKQPWNTSYELSVQTEKSNTIVLTFYDGLLIRQIKRHLSPQVWQGLEATPAMFQSP